MNGILKNIRKISLLTIMFNILKSMARFHFLKWNVRPAQKFEFEMHGLNAVLGPLTFFVSALIPKH